MYKDSANGVKDVWLLPSITGGRAASACSMVSCRPGGSLAGPSFSASWQGLRGPRADSQLPADLRGQRRGSEIGLFLHTESHPPPTAGPARSKAPLPASPGLSYLGGSAQGPSLHVWEFRSTLFPGPLRSPPCPPARSLCLDPTLESKVLPSSENQTQCQELQTQRTRHCPFMRGVGTAAVPVT